MGPLTAQTYLTPAGLAEFLPDSTTTKLSIIIEDVFAQMLAEAPVIDGGTTPLSGADMALVTSILRQAVISYETTGAGNVSTEQEMAGPYSHMTVVDTRQSRRGLLTLIQIDQLHKLQGRLSTTSKDYQAIEVDLLPPTWSYGSASTIWM